MPPTNHLSFFIKSSLIVFISVLLIATIVKAGSITPPSGTPSAQFYTLTDLYNLITTNTTTTAASHSFNFANDLTGTHYTLTQIYNALTGLISADKVKLGTAYLATAGTLTPDGGTASAADLYNGKTVHLTNDWSLDTGTLNLSCNTATFDGSGNLVANAYDGTGTGLNRWCITDSGDAAAANILTGKTCWVDGVAVAGTMVNTGDFGLTCGAANQTVTAGYYSGGTLVGDVDLVSTNIKSGANIFGVDGSFSSATATATTQGQEVTPPVSKWLASVTVAITNLIGGVIKSGQTVGGVDGALTPASGASESLTATNASCGQTYFGSGASSWTPSSGTLCAGRCQACSGGNCGNATSETDVNAECGGSSCCGYCNGSGECAYRTNGITCTTPGTACNGSYKCDGAGGCGLWACGDPVEYAGRSYATVYIGTKCWFAANLNIGTKIAGAGNQTNNGTIEKYCYSDQETYCDTEGGLYQWGEAMAYSTTPGAQGLCPSGWHIPTHDEYTTLERAVCTSGSCATDFPYDSSTTGWRGTNEGTKLKSGGTSGFTGLLAGYRNTDGTFYGRGSNGNFWASLESGSSAWERYFYSGYSTVYRYAYSKAYGFSVRCLKD